MADVLELDVVIGGAVRGSEDTDVWIAIEISHVVDEGDVERLRRRGALLSRTGHVVVAAVAGARLTQGAQASLVSHRMVSIENGRIDGWTEAIASAIGRPQSRS